MSYKCTACGALMETDLVKFTEHTEQHIVDLVKHDHPEWVEDDGLCKKCYEYYRAEIQGSAFKTSGCAIRKRRFQSIASIIKGLFTGH